MEPHKVRDTIQSGFGLHPTVWPLPTRTALGWVVGHPISCPVLLLLHTLVFIFEFITISICKNKDAPVQIQIKYQHSHQMIPTPMRGIPSREFLI